MEQQQQVLKRLQRIFDIFLQENFTPTNNVYFEKLITHLSEKGKIASFRWSVLLLPNFSMMILF